MIAVYINYPNPHITIHASSTCGNVQQQHKEGQRKVVLNTTTLSLELERFENKFYKFGADQSTNDMWLAVDFSDAGFERAVVEYIRRVLARSYSPFGRVSVSEHCV